MKNSKTIEADRIVAAIDETRRAAHFRSPDRPNAKVIGHGCRQDPEVRRAKGRLRTAVYRNRLDQRRAPSTAEIGTSLVTALVTSNMSSITHGDKDLIGRALADLQFRGFDIMEVLVTMRRLRRRLVDHSQDSDNNPVVNV
jgi:hypothetical protein